MHRKIIILHTQLQKRNLRDVRRGTLLPVVTKSVSGPSDKAPLTNNNENQVAFY